MHVRSVTMTLVLAMGGPALAQQEQQAPNAPINMEEQVVVTASRAEQELVNAPAAMSVISSSTIQNSPASNVGDLLRSVPGTNVTQISARDVNITSRGATSTLAWACLPSRHSAPDYACNKLFSRQAIPTLTPCPAIGYDQIRRPALMHIMQFKDSRRLGQYIPPAVRPAGPAGPAAWPTH